MAHEKFDDCIAACNRCADLCDHCSVACLNESDVTALARCIRLDIDCAALCRFAAGAMARDSECAGQICRLCAEACELCGEECAKHQHEHCKECAQACDTCAKECRAMAV